MTIELRDENADHPLSRFMQMVFSRLVAIILIIFALQYWVQLTGISGDPMLRFDVMSEYWQVAGTTLAVVLPVAAVGLWSGYTWGAFVWLLAVAIELAMYGWFSDLFGSRPLVVAFHLLCLVVYGVIRVTAGIIERRSASGGAA